MEWTLEKLLAEWKKQENGCSFGAFIDENFRIDTEDGSLISEGWVFGEGDAYFRNEAAAEAYCQKKYGCAIADLYTDEGSEVYWTEWYELT